MKTGNWSDAENDAIVFDYFEMLMSEIAGEPFIKAKHRRELLKLIDRPESALEFKHQNISAVLIGLGHPWIDGYKPASNFQSTLEDAVIRYLHRHPDWLDKKAERVDTVDRVREVPQLWIGPPPTHSNMPPAFDLKKANALAAKYDVAERDSRNRKLGRAGELRVLENERAILRSARRHDLADRVRWTSDEDGDGAGYDIASFDRDGTPRLIEVKTTNGWERTPFHLTRNELRVADEHRDTWHLIRLWNFAREARGYSIRPPLDRHVELMPTSFLATPH